MPRIASGCAIADVEQRAVGDGLDEARAERVGRDPEGPDVVFERDHFDDIRVRRPRVHQRATQGLEELTVQSGARSGVRPPGWRRR